MPLPTNLKLRLKFPATADQCLGLLGAMTKAPVSAELLEQQVQAGRLWLIIGGQVYDATAWSAVHPGGMLLLQHSAGLDVSAAFAGRAQTWLLSGLDNPLVLCAGKARQRPSDSLLQVEVMLLGHNACCMTWLLACATSA